MQTKREGPWESNLGLEPEWDGASGLWWPVESEDFPQEAENVRFSGSFEHQEHECVIMLMAQLDTSLLQDGSYPESKIIEPSLWHAYVVLPDQNGKSETTPITVFGNLFDAGLSFYSQAIGILRYKLVPQWIIKGAHISSINDCKFDNMILKTNTLPGLLPDRIHAYFFPNRENEDDNSTDIDKIDLKAFEEANTGNFVANIQSPIGENTITLQCGFNKQIGTSISYEPSSVIKYDFPQPIPILNDSIEEPTPLTCLWNWADWMIGMFEIIGNTPTSSAIINTIHQNQGLRLYLNLRLARQEHTLDKVASKIRLDPVDEQNTTSRWNLLLQEWLNAWNLDSNWFIAVDYLRQVLRSTDVDLLSIETYFLYAVRILEARWYAEHGEVDVNTGQNYSIEEIVKSTLDRTNVISNDLECAVGYKFNIETLSRLIACIRNEFTHPATKNKRLKLRELLSTTNNEGVDFLAELLISAALKLIKQEVFNEYISPN